MKLLFDVDSHYSCIKDLINENPSESYISSFGVYAGITHTGVDLKSVSSKYASKANDALSLLHEKDCNVNMLIGVSSFINCRGKVKYCYDCERNYLKQLMRTQSHAELFNRFKWRIVVEHHTKYWIFKFGSKFKGVTGGRNLNDSSWDDITYFIDNEACVEILKNSYLKDRAKSLTINGDNVNKIALEQGISSKTFERMASDIEFD